MNGRIFFPPYSDLSQLKVIIIMWGKVRLLTSAPLRAGLKTLERSLPVGSPLLHTDSKLVLSEFRKVLDDESASGTPSVVVMAGAGLSTPSGIPDFRSPGDGLYSKLKQRATLPYPEAIFEIDYFRRNPAPFYDWCREYLPGVRYRPSIGHFFLKLLQDKGRLLRVYTQNIDGLEVLAGVHESNVVAAHGSFSSASCIE